VALQLKPKLVAIQLWDKHGPVRAWSPDGKSSAKTVSIERGDGGFPIKPGAVEIIAEVACSPADDIPIENWSEVKGLKSTIPSSTLEGDDSKSRLAVFGLLGFPDGKQASVVLSIANGARHRVAGPEELRLNTWKTVTGGFRVRVQNRFVDQEDGERARHAFLDIVLPPKYKNWDVWPVVRSKNGDLSEVAFKEDSGTGEFKFETPAPQTVTLSLKARPYVVYHFENIHLKPR